MVRVLCLHGRGGNSDIFRMQTAAFRGHLNGYDWDFVEGQVDYQEVNGMLYAKNFANDKLYCYYNGLDLPEVVRIEEELLELALTEGPYDGVIGYSQGAQLAAQVITRFQRENPDATLEEQPFRFAVFFNGPTPNTIFTPTEPLKPIMDLDFEGDLEARMFLKYMKDNPSLSALSVNGTDGAQQLKKMIDHKVPTVTTKSMNTTVWPAELPSGRRCLTDGKLAYTRADSKTDGRLIKKIGTVHVRCLGDYIDFGQGTYDLCDPELASEYHHEHQHDFPRGYDEMRKIAELIRAAAERFC